MDPEPDQRRIMAGELYIEYNSLPEGHPDRRRLLKEIFPEADDPVFVWGPAYVDIQFRSFS